MSVDDAGRKRKWTSTGFAAFVALAVVGVVIVTSDRLPDVDEAARDASALAQADANTTTVQTAPLESADTQSAAARPSASSATGSLPPPGTPLAQTYDALEIRAERGDAAAASRLYHDVHRCSAVNLSKHILAQEMPAVDGETRGMSADQLQKREGMLKALQEQIDYVNANAALCDGATAEQVGSFIPVSLQAARLGDLKALDCYVGTHFDMMTGLLDHPEWLAQYRENAPRLVDAAMRRGDWVVVELMHHAYAGIFTDSPRTQMVTPDPVMEYRYLQLERLGARGAFVDKLDGLLAHAAEALTSQQLAEANAWAQEEYTRYFSGSASNEVSNGSNICQISDD
jgi:hypothetical protein